MRGTLPAWGGVFAFIKENIMKEHQYRQLLALAEHPDTAGKLLGKLDESPRLANILWDVYCVALLTVSEGGQS